MGRDLDRVVREIYAVPPGDFTRARNAGAAALKAAGHTAEAREVGRLRRPPFPLWAANQLAHAEPERLAAFLATVDRVRQTQLRDPKAAGEAVQRQRAELEALVRRAGDLLSKHGHPATPPTIRRISDTLLGAAVDRGLANDLRHGRLTAERQAPGFEVLAGVEPARHLRLLRPDRDAGRRQAAARRGAADAEREHLARKVERQAREHERQEQERERRAREAEAQRRQAELAEAAERAQQEVRDLQAQIDESRRRLRAARQAAARASTAARRATRRAGT